MQTVSATGRQALGEMRGLLGVLRDDQGDRASAAAAGRCSEIDQLVGQVRAAGLPVAVAVEGDVRELPAGRAADRLPPRAGGAHQLAQARGPEGARRSCACATTRAGVDVEVSDDGTGDALDRAGRARARAERHARARRRLRRHGRGRAAAGGRLARAHAARDRGTGGRAMTTSVLLVDDQPLLRVGFRMVLESQDDLAVVGEAGDGAEAVRLTAELDPDVVLMDVRMPEMDGIEATRRIVASGSRSRVLILTTFDLDEYAFAAPARRRERLPAQGRAARATCSPASARSPPAMPSSRPSVTRRLLDSFAHRLPAARPSQAELDAAARRASPRASARCSAELARGHSNAEIAAQLVLSEATVKTHVGRILAKLDLRDRVQVVVFAYEIGLVQPSQLLSPRPHAGHPPLDSRRHPRCPTTAGPSSPRRSPAWS